MSDRTRQPASRGRIVLQAFGASTLVLLYRIWPQLSPHHAGLYHSFLPMQTVFWGLLIDLGVSTIVFTLLFLYLEQAENGVRNALWAFIAAELIPPLVQNAAALWRTALPNTYMDWAFYGSLGTALILRWANPRAYVQAVRAGRFAILLIGCSVLWIVPELLFYAVRHQAHDAALPVLRARSSGVAPPARRIVWLLFDELSYDQTFDHRATTLRLPAFDRFRQNSTSFSDLQPDGFRTDRVVPSFFLGQTITDLQSDLDGRLSIKTAVQNRWQRFDAAKTLFADAQALGWSTGIVGWHNPYCRLLAGTLNYCFWRMGDAQWTGNSPYFSALQNAAAPVEDVVQSFMRHPPPLQQQKHAADLDALLPTARTLLRDESISFVFIHLPVPHPPGIYRRDGDQNRFSGTYLDNLVLADNVLGELMNVINATALAPNTTVIVCSDHSWRTGLWQDTPQWSAEEEAAIRRNRFDPRPVLMIHSPGQKEAREIRQPFPELRLHGILEEMLRTPKQDYGVALR